MKRRVSEKFLSFIVESELKIIKIRNEAAKQVKHAVGHKEEDIKVFKEKVKGSEIQISSKDKEIIFLKNKIKRLEKVLKVHT